MIPRSASHRRVLAHQIPEALAGRTFLRSSLDHTEATVTRDGMVYVLTPSDGRNPDSVHDELLNLGFAKTNTPEFLLLQTASRPDRNHCSVYQKRATAGETLSFGKWGVLVY